MYVQLYPEKGKFGRITKIGWSVRSPHHRFWVNLSSAPEQEIDAAPIGQTYACRWYHQVYIGGLRNFGIFM